MTRNISFLRYIRAHSTRSSLVSTIKRFSTQSPIWRLRTPYPHKAHLTPHIKLLSESGDSASSHFKKNQDADNGNGFVYRLCQNWGVWGWGGVPFSPFSYSSDTIYTKDKTSWGTSIGMCIDLTVKAYQTVSHLSWQEAVLQGTPTLTQDFPEGPCYSMRDAVWFINCVSIFYTSCLSVHSSHWPHSAPCSVPTSQGSEMRTQRLAVEVRLERCVRQKYIQFWGLHLGVWSHPADLRSPIWWFMKPEGSTKSRMAFCKLGRNHNYHKLHHHGLEPCVSGSLLTAGNDILHLHVV